MKKFLSLVLALVMTMSLVTISAGAKDFTDGSKIQYNEAIDVMSACKVIDGYADGSFNPSATLTRGAAAKIICNMILGPTTAGALSADAAPYKDVPANSTFAGYIAYCAKEGIISGYADGTFRPGNTLTGYAFMKMLLGALGYDASIEGYTGNNWSIAVAKRALNIGLDDDLVTDFDGTKAVTREEACLYAFNALKADMVEYEDNSTITVGDITIVNNSKATAMTWSNGTANKNDRIDNDGVVQFAEKYFDKLSISTKAADKIDDFGRPATTWVYDGDSVGTYADDADDSMILNKDLAANKVLITDTDYFDYDDEDVTSGVELYVNGEKQSDTKAGLSGVTLKAGDEIEVFENSNDDVATVAVIRWSLAQIDEIETSLSSTYTKKGATCSITLKNLADASIGGTYYDAYDGDSDKELAGFSKDTYTEDTVLAVAMKGDVVLASHVAETAEGKVTAYDNGTKAKVTLAGTAYPITSTVNMASGDKGYRTLEGLFNYDDSTYTAYLDKNGYVIGIDETESVKIEDVYYVAGVIEDTSRYTTVYAQAVSLTDGTITEFKLKDTNANAKVLGLTTSTATVSGAVTSYAKVQGLYTFDKDGSSYNAVKYTSASDNTYYVFGTVTANDATDTNLADDLARDDTKLTVSGTKVYLDGNTNYVKVEDDAADIDVKCVTGGTSVKKTWTPSGGSAIGTDAIVVAKKDSKNYLAAYVVLISDSFSNSGSDDIVFIHDKSSTKVSYTDADGDTRTGWKTELWFMDGSGKKETVIVEGSTAKAEGFYTWEINDDDVYELTAKSQALSIAGSAYDDETGYVGYGLDSNGDFTTGHTLTGIYNNALTAADLSGKALADVDFAENVIIADDRSKATRDGDPYTTEITSVSQLKTAIDKPNSDVKAIVYYDDEEVIMVYVLEMVDTTPVAPSNSTALTTLKIKGQDVADGSQITVMASENTGATTTLVKEDAAQAITAKWYDSAAARSADTTGAAGSVWDLDHDGALRVVTYYVRFFVTAADGVTKDTIDVDVDVVACENLSFSITNARVVIDGKTVANGATLEKKVGDTVTMEVTFADGYTTTKTVTYGGTAVPGYSGTYEFTVASGKTAVVVTGSDT